jgi:hypothetical protein
MFAFLFGKKKSFGPQNGALSSEHTQDEIHSVLNQNYTSEYHFNQVSFRQPGIAYHSPLLQFQSYPDNSLQGAGTVVQRFFRPFEAQTVNQVNTPVTSGTSGIIAGVIASQPLIDTTRSAGTVGD